jgi:hypothetical protein
MMGGWVDRQRERKREREEEGRKERVGVKNNEFSLYFVISRDQ